ncbi:epithelial-stromal interaction protein 1 isoform 2-T2 [Polymixia lowei]
MKPHHNYKDRRNHLNDRRNPTDPRNSSSNMSENDELPENAPDSANAVTTPQQTVSQQQPESSSGNRHSEGFTMIPPNESRRSKLKMMAQKEEDDLQRWKESHRATSVHMTPEKLGGGDVLLADAREKQFRDLRQSKLQKQLKKEEQDRRKRQEEEEELQNMKAKQREKAERLEEKRRQEEQGRREQLRQDHLRTTESFLQRFEQSGPSPLSSSSATHTSSWRVQQYNERQREEDNSALQLMKQEQRSKSEALEEKEEERRSKEQMNHRRVNAAFLDKLEVQGAAAEREGGGEVKHRPLAFDDFDPPTHLTPNPGHSSSDWAEEAEPEPDFEWNVMKLESIFPSCKRVFLEDILTQCNNDYEQAYMLLSE